MQVEFTQIERTKHIIRIPEELTDEQRGELTDAIESACCIDDIADAIFDILQNECTIDCEECKADDSKEYEDVKFTAA